MKIGCHKRRLLPFLFPLVKTSPMSRFSSVLFAVGFGLFASLTTLVSCGDTSDDPIDTPTKEESTHKASDSASKGLPGVYKIELKFETKVSLPAGLDVTALFDSQKCSPTFAHYADSVVASAKTKLEKEYASVSVRVPDVSKLDIPQSPIIITTLPTAHGCNVSYMNMSGETLDCFVQVKVYYNNVQILAKRVNLADDIFNSLTVTIGNPAVDLMKPLENHFQIE